MTGMKEPAEHHHFWVQAPVPPLDVDGLAVVTVGTVIFALTSVVLAIGYNWLAAHGHGSWLQISVAGFVSDSLCWRIAGIGGDVAAAEPNDVAPWKGRERMI